MLFCAKIHITAHPAHLVMHQGVVGKLEPASQTEAQARGGGPSTPGATQAITSLDRGCQHGGRAQVPGDMTRLVYQQFHNKSKSKEYERNTAGQLAGAQ